MSSPEPDDGIDSASELRLKRFTEICLERVKNLTPTEVREYGKKLELPLARIKKIMKIDELATNQMISSESPLILAVAAEFLVEEMTLRAWIHANQHRRKTIQKSDVAASIAGCEMFDFLIDIVPRDEPVKTRGASSHSAANDQDQVNHADMSMLQQLDAGQFYYATNEHQQIELPLPNGQIELGQPMPFSAVPGEQIILMTDNGEQVHLLVNPTEQQQQ
uniref:CBFD_NFYB_HMF domain-containing protein n=1 Tax=Panagrellus redivivus TaxID=6233 RepID=A0A7E4ZQF3_PANRE